MQSEVIYLSAGKKIYFLSDFHLGAPNEEKSFEREKKIIRWMDGVKSDAQAIFFVGDVYDFWFEYKYTVPKGFVRFQGKLAELVDHGIQLYFFRGNHDLWMFDYYKKLFNSNVYRKPIKFFINDKRFYIAHGDGLGPGDYIHKIILIFFESKFFQWLFTLLPTNFCYWIANKWSKGSRASNDKHEEAFLGENEWLWCHAKSVEKTEQHDFYIFGHRHLPLDLPVGENSRYVNLGDWLVYFTYAEFDGINFNFKKFED